MTDIARLGFRVDSDRLRRATDRLDDFSSNAKASSRATDDLNRNMDRSNGVLRRMNSNFGQLMRKMRVMLFLIGGISAAVIALRQEMAGLATAAGAVLVEVMLDPLRDRLRSVTQGSRNLRTTMSTLMGTTRGLGVAFLGVGEGVSQVAQASIAAGNNMGETTTIIRGFTKSASSMGVATGDVNTLLVDLAGFIKEGRVEMSDLQEAVSFMPDPLQTLADAFGTNVTKIQQMIEEGTTLSDEALVTLADHLRDNTTVSKGLDTAWANLLDTLTNLGRGLADMGIIDSVTRQIQRLTRWLQTGDAQRLLQGLGDFANRMINETLPNLVIGMRENWNAIITIMSAAAGFLVGGAVAGPLGGVIGAIFGAIIVNSPKARDAIVGLVGALQSFLDVSSDVISKSREIGEELSSWNLISGGRVPSDQFRQQVARNAEAMSDAAEQGRSYSGVLGDMMSQQLETGNTALQARRDTRDYRRALDDLTTSTGDAETVGRGFNDVIGDMVSDAMDAARATGRLRQSHEDTVSVLQERIRGGEEAAEIERRWNQVKVSGADISREQVAAMVTEEQKLRDYIENTRSASEEWIKIWDNAVENMQRQFSDSIYGALWKKGIDSFGDFADSVLDIWKRMVAEMLSAWVTSGIAGIFNGKGFGGFNVSFGGASDAGQAALSLSGMGGKVNAGLSSLGAELGLTGGTGATATALPATTAPTVTAVAAPSGAIEAGTGALTTGEFTAVGGGGAGAASGGAAATAGLGTVAAGGAFVAGGMMIARAILGSGPKPADIAARMLASGQGQPGSGGLSATQVSGNQFVGGELAGLAGMLSGEEVAKFHDQLVQVNTEVKDLDKLMQTTAETFNWVQAQGTQAFKFVGADAQRVGEIIKDGVVTETEAASIGLRHLGAVSTTEFGQIARAVNQGEVRLAALQGTVELTEKELQVLGQIGITATGQIASGASGAQDAVGSIGADADRASGRVKSFGQQADQALKLTGQKATQAGNMIGREIEQGAGRATAAIKSIPTSVDVNINETVTRVERVRRIRGGGPTGGPVPGRATGDPNVPQDMVVRVHRGEKIIDAQAASALERYFNAESPPQQQGGGDIVINQTIQGVTPDDVERQTRRVLRRELSAA